MKMSDVFPSTYLKASDFPRPRKVTVREIRLEEIGGEESKPICFFHEGKKGLILNITNANTLKALAGGDDDMESWIGLEVEIYVTPVQFRNRMVDGMRLRPLPQIVAKAGPKSVPKAKAKPEREPGEEEALQDFASTIPDDEVPF